MFGADTPLMMDALQIVALTAAVSVGGAVLWIRRGKRPASRAPSDLERTSFKNAAPEPTNLEQRVRVLERIATDRPADLAEEIETLRSKTAPERTKQTEGTL